MMPKCKPTSELAHFYRFCPDCQRQCACYHISEEQATKLVWEYRVMSKDWTPVDPGIVLYILEDNFAIGEDSDVESKTSSQTSEESDGTAWLFWRTGKGGEGDWVTPAPGHFEIEDTRGVVDETMMTGALPNPEEFENRSVSSNDASIIIGAEIVPPDVNKPLPLPPIPALPMSPNEEVVLSFF